MWRNYLNQVFIVSGTLPVIIISQDLSLCGDDLDILIDVKSMVQNVYVTCTPKSKLQALTRDGFSSILN
jgi:hypothetical protein